MKGRLLELIEDACDEASRPGWDGDGGEPVSEATYSLAKLFAQSLPDDLPAPQRVIVSHNGGIGIEWCPHTPQRAVYVSICGDGIDWAVIEFGKPCSGQIDLPDCRELVEAIRRINEE